MRATDGVSFSPEEAQVLNDLVALHGRSWKKVYPAFQKQTGIHRSVSSLRNRVQRVEKGRRIVHAEGVECRRNRCRRCGLIKMGHTCPVEPSSDDTRMLSDASSDDYEDYEDSDGHVDRAAPFEEADATPCNFDLVRFRHADAPDYRLDRASDSRILALLEEYCLFPSVDMPPMPPMPALDHLWP